MNKVNRILQQIEMFIGSLFLGLMLILVSVSIVFRYVLNNPILWAQELTNYLFVWLGFLAAAYVLANSDHIRITFVYSRLTKKRQAALEIVMNVLLVVMFISFFVPSVQALKFLQAAPALRIPGWITHLITPAMFALFLLHTVNNTWKRIAVMTRTEE